MSKLLRSDWWSRVPPAVCEGCISICANKANLNLNVSYYALDVSMFEVLTLMWVGRERGMRQRRSVGGG